MLDEALEAKVDCIVTYHPLLFASTKRFTCGVPVQRTALRCVEARVGVFSHHTAIDAKKGGVNDWLLSAFAGSYDAAGVAPAQPADDPFSATHKIVSFGARAILHRKSFTNAKLYLSMPYLSIYLSIYAISIYLSIYIDCSASCRC